MIVLCIGSRLSNELNWAIKLYGIYWLSEQQHVNEMLMQSQFIVKFIFVITVDTQNPWPLLLIWIHFKPTMDR